MPSEHGPTGGDMTASGGCGRCGYSLLELARTDDSVQCPECGHWNQRPEFLNYFPWPRTAGVAWRLCWPAGLVVLTLPLAWLALPPGLAGLCAMALVVLGAAAPMVAAMRLVRIRCAPERQGRVMGLLAAAGMTVNLGVLLGILVVVARIV